MTTCRGRHPGCAKKIVSKTRSSALVAANITNAMTSVESMTSNAARWTWRWLASGLPLNNQPTQRQRAEPGDLFCLGAPGTAGAGEAGAGGQFLEPGDVVDSSIQGVASLRTTIVAAGQA